MSTPPNTAKTTEKMSSLNYKLSRLCMKVKPKEFGALLKWLFQIKREVYQHGDFKIWLDPATKLGESLLGKGDYEIAISSFMMEHLKKGGTFVDLGANEGFFSMLAFSLIGDAGRVIAIEPQVRLWPILLQNIAVNRAFRVQILPTAVSERTEEVDMVLFPNTNSGASTLVQEGGSQMHSLRKRQKVNTIRLDELLEKAGVERVDLLKVDIEGYEGLALRSAEKSLKKKMIRLVAVEYHPERLRALGEDIQKIDQFIISCGYKHLNRQDGWAFYGVD